MTPHYFLDSGARAIIVTVILLLTPVIESLNDGSMRSCLHYHHTPLARLATTGFVSPLKLLLMLPYVQASVLHYPYARLINSWLLVSSPLLLVDTSNVDGHFLRAGFSPSSVLELHGSCTGEYGWFCSHCAKTDTDPERFRLSCAAIDPDFRFAVDSSTMTVSDTTVDDTFCSFGRKPNTDAGWLRCDMPDCTRKRRLLRPRVHMFNESDSSLLAALATDESRYVEWECAMEAAVCGYTQEPASDDGDKKPRPRLVLLEIGCGLTVPSVRMEMECVMRDMLKELSDRMDGSNSPPKVEEIDDLVTMIRVNPLFPQNPGFEKNTISLRLSAKDALERIDNALKVLSAEED